MQVGCSRLPELLLRESELCMGLKLRQASSLAHTSLYAPTPSVCFVFKRKSTDFKERSVGGRWHSSMYPPWLSDIVPGTIKEQTGGREGGGQGSTSLGKTKPR